jgi:hypothetical protein
MNVTQNAKKISIKQCLRSHEWCVYIIWPAGAKYSYEGHELLKGGFSSREEASVWAAKQKIS